MLQRIADLEAEVNKLKAEKSDQAIKAETTTSTQVQPQAPVVIEDSTAQSSAFPEYQRGLQFRGFGDVDLQQDNLVKPTDSSLVFSTC